MTARFPGMNKIRAVIDRAYRRPSAQSELYVQSLPFSIICAHRRCARNNLASLCAQLAQERDRARARLSRGAGAAGSALAGSHIERSSALSVFEIELCAVHHQQFDDG